MDEVPSGDVYLCVQQALKLNVTSLLDEGNREYICETLLAEWEEGPPAEVGQVQEILHDLILSMAPDTGVEWTSEDVDDVCSCLWRLLERTREEIEKENRVAEVGGCEMCDREMPISRHHLIPRSVHKLFGKRGKTFEELNRTIDICRQCHNAVHKMADEKTLGAEYDTLEKLLAVESLQRFIKFAQTQRVYSKADTLNKNFKYAR